MNRLFINKEWSPLKKLLFMNAASGGNLNEYTVTGNPVSFNTNVAKPLKQLLIPFTPVQSGSGDPSPSNVRPITGWTGVTAYSTGESLIDSTVRDINTETRIGLGCRYGYYDVTLSAGTYTIAIGYNSSDSYNIYYRGQLEADGIKIANLTTISPPYIQTATFTISADEGCYFWVYRSSGFGGVNNNNIAWFTLVEGSEPLIPTSIPITFPAVGKNKAKFLQTGYINSQGTIVPNDSNALCEKVFMQSGQTVVMSSTEGNRGFAVFSDSELTDIISRTGSGASTYTATEDCYFVGWFALPSGIVASQATMEEYSCQTEFGSTATTYEPFTNTVYGGTLDVTTGVLTVDWVKYIATNNSSLHGGGSSYNGEIGTNRFIYLYDNIANYSSGVYSDQMKRVGHSTWDNPDNDLWNFYVNAGNQLHMVFQNETVGITSGMTAGERTTAIKSWLADNNITFVLPLATPVEFQLSDINVPVTLIGDNTVWTDTNGENTIKYLKKG